MIIRGQEAIEEHLLQLVAACRACGLVATKLAPQARMKSLQALLYERADRYRRSADELRGCLQILPQVLADRPWGPTLTSTHGADVATVWEATECAALIYFRDALDAEMPLHIEDAVLRHIEDGVSALEQLRALRLQENRRSGAAKPTAPASDAGMRLAEEPRR
jgi:hypothetical protein